MKKTKDVIDPAIKGILYALSKRTKPSPTTSILIDVSESGFASTTTAYSRVDFLVSKGLVEESYGKGSTARYLSLTEKGKKVVEYLKKIDEVMEG